MKIMKPKIRRKMPEGSFCHDVAQIDYVCKKKLTGKIALLKKISCFFALLYVNIVLQCIYILPIIDNIVVLYGVTETQTT
jgi:hypothetical protein